MVTMGTTPDEPLMHAQGALRDYATVQHAAKGLEQPSAMERIETPVFR